MAAGLGELSVHSAIGAPLQARIAIISEEGEPLDDSCFSLRSTRDPELPDIGPARLRLERQPHGWFLDIRGQSPLNEPLANLSVRIDCGPALQRDYIVLPLPPGSSSAEMAQTPARQRSRRNSPATTAASEEFAASTADSPPAAPRPRAAKKSQAPAAPQADRLILSTTPLAIGENENQRLRLETSLQQLQQSLDSLNQALSLRAESQRLRRELQMAENLQALPALTLANDPLRGEPPWRQWLELIFGMFVGGAISAFGLQWLTSHHAPPARAQAAQTGLSRSRNSQRKAKRPAR